MNESQSNKFGLNYDFVLGWSLPRYYTVFENYRKCLILSGQKIIKIAKKIVNSVYGQTVLPDKFKIQMRHFVGDF